MRVGRSEERWSMRVGSKDSQERGGEPWTEKERRGLVGNA